MIKFLLTIIFNGFALFALFVLQPADEMKVVIIVLQGLWLLGLIIDLGGTE